MRTRSRCQKRQRLQALQRPRSAEAAGVTWAVLLGLQARQELLLSLQRTFKDTRIILTGDAAMRRIKRCGKERSLPSWRWRFSKMVGSEERLLRAHNANFVHFTRELVQYTRL